jgi:cytochrome c oxidase subunit II
MVVLMMTIVVLFALTLGLQQAPSPGPPTSAKATVGKQAPGPVVIRVSAERFAFTPSEIVVEKGATIEFHLTSDDTDHGFRILGTDVNAEIPKRRRGETIVKYVADTEGRFIIECSRPCGAGHTAMRATLIVK